MISEEAFETLRSFADLIFQRELGAVRHRVELRNAIGELMIDRNRSKAAAAVMADPDGPTENVRRLRADRDLVDRAIAHHVSEGLKQIPPATRPTTGDLWPTSTYAAAQWHATRVQLLTLAPVTVAAAALREEALAALDSNPKEQL